MLATLTATAVVAAAGVNAAHAVPGQVDVSGPAGSGEFGTQVVVLPNGNVVVTDPYYSPDTDHAAEGAVYLYNGVTHAVISTLTGSTAGDNIGYDGVTVLANGNYVIASEFWHDPTGPVSNVGAVTWGSATTGVSGTVSASNSLIGSGANDQVGSARVTALPNGNYVVRTPVWDNPTGPVSNAGAVTWGNGTTGTIGRVSPTNSLVGSSESNMVGFFDIVVLSNGNYVVPSPLWDNPIGPASNAGAVTWVDGATGATGPVTAANSLIGTTPSERLGGYAIAALTNGNYVVGDPYWDNPVGPIYNAGAAILGDGSTGGPRLVGPVTAANSLIGSTTDDNVGRTVTALSNGNYVVSSYQWDNPSGPVSDAGAVTWGNGTTGTTGVVTSANSAVGSSGGDEIGRKVIALSNGNYVVDSEGWDNPVGPVSNAGAVTWGDGATSGARLVGPVSTSNSLVGSTTGDRSGVAVVVALSNGNYVVTSPEWDNPVGPVENVGAVTWGNGSASGARLVGTISAANSLIGSTSGDRVSSGGVVALANGNYVVASEFWNDPTGPTEDVGAVTWGNGSASGARLVGTISVANSMIGSTSADRVSSSGVVALSNGNYVVTSPEWDNPVGPVENVGAVTWGNGSASGARLVGTVSASNSLVGSTIADQVGSGAVKALSNGNYLVVSYDWDNPSGPLNDVGAVTWGNGTIAGPRLAGALSGDLSVMGAAAAYGTWLTAGFDYVNHQLVVARAAENVVTWASVPNPDPDPELPPTGADTGGFVTTAVALLAAGAVLVGVRRRVRAAR